ncbi:MAG: hypothetical protein KF881_01880 [Acidobacteria bacterium]|nr:hypothetical protein [Acidobacteriota bacterium]
MRVNLSRIKWRQYLLLVGVLIFIPFPTIRTAEWRLSIVDENGNLLRGVNVEYQWIDYDYFQEGFETLRSNDDGEILIASRTLWGNLASRVAFPAFARMSTLVHGSDGLSIFVRVYDTELKYVSESGDQIHWYSNWDSEKELPSVIVGRRQANWYP